jgi:hypothetical protein
MKQHAVLVMTLIAAGMVSACSDDSGDRTPAGGAGGGAGSGGGAGTAGAGGPGGAAGTAGSAGSTGTPAPPPTPALPSNAATVACPTVINGSLDASDPTQTGRHSRITPVSACGATKAFPGNAADPSNPHLFDVYRFSNPGTSTACFNFELSYGTIAVADAGLDAGADAAAVDAGSESALDAGADAGDAGAAPPVSAAARYMTAYSTFYPTALANSYLGDVGDNLAAPQSMGVTVPAGATVDVVIYAIDVAPAGTGAYTLRCTAQ